MDPAALARARFLAVRMLACDYSGGCGPGGHMSVIECGNTGTCRPGISTDDVWRQNHAPSEFELAVRLRDSLRANREGPGGD
jgi:hypothetical protein